MEFVALVMHWLVVSVVISAVLAVVLCIELAIDYGKVGGRR